MKKNELLMRLNQEKIPVDAYSLSGGLPNEKFCVNKNEYWEVYYSERGIKTQLKKFNTEEEAYDYLYSILHKSF